ncbi:MAG TPA: cobyrinate a,c-diamide synthase [Spirochaetota bacterium]|nr:cobyrinate a,c-diamide synthase [Spirochaetota bacterium]HOD14392.1 cobyrinate a,c-diamide synthase [Spirochaetota bacterium]HPN11752.1 cobyrinate a,c-diamide synthase [Spirochaetota bacterium]
MTGPSGARPGIAVGGMRGGSGKTVLSLGLIRALTRRGLTVAPFKKGPDYIDPSWLSAAAGVPCYNLDLYLLENKENLRSYRDSNPGADWAVVEGNRGLFDGLDAEGSASFAELVKLLDIPLLLVIDCSKSSRTVAALVRGCETFDPELAPAGIVLNQVAGERHSRTVAEAIARYCATPVLGALPRMADLSLDERRLGIVPTAEHDGPDAVIERLADAVEKHVDLAAIMKIAESWSTSPVYTPGPLRPSLDVARDRPAASPARGGGRDGSGPVRRVGVVRDAAFHFYYAENLDALERQGAEIVAINSLADAAPPVIDALYIGGGFPENHAGALSGNAAFRRALKKLIEGGLPVYAECGGLIYLSTAITVEGRRYPMTGIFPLEFEMSDRPVGHGYTLFEVDGDNPFYRKGTAVRGHEFRYARIINPDAAADVRTVLAMRRGAGVGGGRDGMLVKNCLAVFSHTHAGSAGADWIVSLAGAVPAGITAS